MIPLDKQAHFLGGYAIAITLVPFGTVLALVTAIVAGALKEAWDARHPENHTVDGVDFLATALGGGVAVCVDYLLWSF